MGSKSFIKTISIASRQLTLLGEAHGLLYWKYENYASTLLVTEGDKIVHVTNYALQLEDTDRINITSVAPCNNGDTMLCGIYRSKSYGYNFNFIIRINSQNEILWSKDYTYEENAVLGNLPKIKALPQGKYVILLGHVIFISDENGFILNSVIHNNDYQFDNHTLKHIYLDIEIFGSEIFLLGAPVYINNPSISTNVGVYKICKLDINLKEIDYAEYYSPNPVEKIFSARFKQGFIKLDENNLAIISFVDRVYLIKINISDISSNQQEGLLVGNLFNYAAADEIGGITSNSDSIFINPRLTKIVHKFDHNLNLVWSKEVSNHIIRNMIAQDDSIFLSSRGFSGSPKFIRTNSDFFDDICFNIPPISNIEFTQENEILIKETYSIYNFSPYFPEVRDLVFNLNDITNYNSVQLCPDTPILSLSTITAEPNQIESNGITKSFIKVQLNEGPNNPIDTGEFNVEIKSTKGLISAITSDHEDGIYTAVLTSFETGEASVSFLVNGEMSPNNSIVKLISRKPFVKGVFYDGRYHSMRCLGVYNEIFYWTYQPTRFPNDVNRIPLPLIKTDRNINILSAIHYGVLDFETTIISMTICSNGDAIYVGNKSLSQFTGRSIIVFRVDNENNLIWNKEYRIDENLRHLRVYDIISLSSNRFLVYSPYFLFTLNGSSGELLHSCQNLYYLEGLGGRGSIEVIDDKILLFDIRPKTSTSPSTGYSSIESPSVINIIVFDDTLTIIDKAEYFSNDNLLNPKASFSLVRSIKLSSGEIILSVHLSGERYYFIKINNINSFENSLQVSLYNYVPKNPTSTAANYGIVEGKDGIYFTIDNIVFKTDNNLNLLWSKELLNFHQFGNLLYPNNLLFDNENLFLMGFLFGESHNGVSTASIFRFDSDLTDDLCVQYPEINPIQIFENEVLVKHNELINGVDFPSTVLNTSTYLLNSNTIDEYQIVQHCPDVPLLNVSTITAEPNQIESDGYAESLITVQLNEGPNNPIDTGEFNVEIKSTIGLISSVISDHESGIYTAVLTSLETGEASVSFLVDGELSPNTTTTTFTKPFELLGSAFIQSPHLYLQAAGSTDGDGDLSTPGIHLRWTLKNKLGDEHLPKGNLATGTANYNKPGDYATVYRASYTNEQLTISLEQEPQVMDHSNAYWLYTINSNKYYIIFRDKERYLGLIDTIDPRNGNRLGFLEAYGDGLIEVETRDQLAYGVKFNTNKQTSTSRLQTEILSVEANKLSLTKNVIGRKTFTGTALNSAHQFGDNIRSVRFKASNCYVTLIHIELYQTFLQSANEGQNWVSLGEFSLTTSDEQAFKRLEKSPDTVHGKWPRYNENCPVNLDNYRDKWNGPREEGDRNLKQIIKKYIELSNAEDNPKALETIDFTDPSITDGLRDLQEVSNLNMLFLAGTDYHMARMMGLGHLDTSIENDDQKFIYMVEYHTKGDLGGAAVLGGGLLNPDGVQHLYMTVPTSIHDSRLPYPVDLLKIEPGIKRTGLDENSTLTNPDGYTDIGKQRYLSIYAKEQIEYENESFYETAVNFNYSEATHPVYAGISYKEKGTGNNWIKPEISSSADYLTAGPNPTSETVPLPIPLMGEPLFVHRVVEEGTHQYLGYSINWFGRSNASTENPLEIRTEFPTINLLKPAAALHALHVVEENPLILTSANEQIRLKNNQADDSTIARLLFSYNHEQELINYPVSDDDRVLFTDAELLAPAVFRPDKNDIFANEIEVFFRNRIPQNIRGKITAIADDPIDQAISILTTEDYTLYSEKIKNENSGEYEFVKIKPELPENIPEVNFTGGLFILGQQQFIIHSINVDGNGYARIKVYKKAVGEALLGNATEGLLEGPDISGDDIFMAIENMLTIDSWGTGNPNTFKVQIPDEVSTIHRTLVETTGGSDTNELLLEKSRGLYDDAVTITPVLEASEVDENNQETATIHRGTYKIQLSKTLTQHPQFSTTGNSVEWQGGAIRIPTEANPKDTKRTLKVVKIENVGSTNGLVLYAVDDTFTQEIIDPDTGKIIGYQSENPILTTGNITINFYPGYTVYLYADSNFGLTNSALQPSNNESINYSIFGVRTKGDEYKHTEGNPPVFVETHYSNIGTPTNMFSQAIIPPLRPQLPIGANYATRPDSFGKATYTFTTAFNHKPFALQYSRTDEQGILNVLYKPSTINAIKAELNTLSKDVYATSRWKNLIGFNYSSHGGEFEKFPNTENGYRFPNPDNPTLFQLINRDIDKFNLEENPSPKIKAITAGSINPGSIIIPGIGSKDETILTHYIEKAVLSVFVPLTEIPLIYSQIRDDSNYQPINKKQVIRDRNGTLLKPTDSDYDIAPMAKRVANKNELQFTDFTLDGTSSNIYFYTVRELSSAMQMGDYSPVIGPINLVNTNPPIAPEIRRAIPRLADKNYGLKQIPLDFVSIENLTITGDTIIHEGGVFGGATSKQILEGNGIISYQVNAESSIIIGFAKMHINKETETVDYGFICTQAGDLIVRNKGILTTVSNYDSGTLLQIERIGNTLYFLKNSVVLHQFEIETPTDLQVTISVRNKIATVTNIKLYSSGRYYDTEILESNTLEPLPITITNLDNSTLSAEGILAKQSTTNAWDSGAISLEYIPFYGSLSFNVLSNKIVAVGLATFNEERHLNSIEYGIRTNDDGLLYITSKGEDLITGVPYNENSNLSIERRNQLLLFKNNGRTFYQLTLDENMLLWADFAIHSNDGTISNIEINETSRINKNYLDTTISVPAIALEFNGYPVNQKISTLNLYRTLDSAKSSSVRSMDLVKTVDLRLTGQVGKTVLKITDEFEDLAQVPYGDAIYYRATVSREVTYTLEKEGKNKTITELAPSNASRLIISTITESTNPTTPELFYTVDTASGNNGGENISLQWKRTVYNPKYFVFKMNTQGNWVKIHEFESNEDVVRLQLSTTSLTPEELSLIDETFHHFRVNVENSAGLSNIDKNLITIPGNKIISQ